MYIFFWQKTKSIIQCRNFGIIQSCLDIDSDSFFSWHRLKIFKRKFLFHKLLSGPENTRDGILPSRILLMLAFLMVYRADFHDPLSSPNFKFVFKLFMKLKTLFISETLLLKFGKRRELRHAK